MKLIDDDGKRAARKHQPPELDGDAFVDAQEWEVKAFAVDVQDGGTDKATAKVTFNNFDQVSTVTLALAQAQRRLAHRRHQRLGWVAAQAAGAVNPAYCVSVCRAVASAAFSARMRTVSTAALKIENSSA